MKNQKARLATHLMTLVLFAVLGLQSTEALAKTPWQQLSPKQQELLEPVREQWSGMNSSQQERWLRMSERYESERPERQAIMRDRVGDWSNLSPQERAEARRNFKTLKEKEKGERNSSWNSYQTLPPHERNEYSDRRGQREYRDQRDNRDNKGRVN